MKKTTIVLLAAGLISAICLSGPAQAHFGMIIPSDSMVEQRDGNNLTLTLSFSHPFEGIEPEKVLRRCPSVPAKSRYSCIPLQSQQYNVFS